MGQEDMMTQKLLPDAQRHLFEKSYQEQLEEERNRPVECLGMTFPSDEERRKHFLGILREKLKDPEFRKIEGFPIGTDKDILALSDPPYYTACPNPFLVDILEEWRSAHQAQTQAPRSVCTDVGGGSKTARAYTLHTYHSKIPPETLAKLIDHYAQEGDVILDPFCGSGMTGVAASMVSESAGRSLLCVEEDLSPAASFISHVYAHPPSAAALLAEGKEVLRATSAILNSLYCDESGTFDYTLFSDVFLCTECGNKLVFWDIAVDKDALEFKGSMICPFCGKDVNKGSAARHMTVIYDPILKKTVRLALQVPVARKRASTLRTFDGLAGTDDPQDLGSLAVPVLELPRGANLSQPQKSHGITHVHHLFTWRNLSALAHLWSECGKQRNAHALRFVLTSFMVKTGSKLHNIGFKNGSINLAGQLPNTYYIPNLTAERNVAKMFNAKLEQACEYFSGVQTHDRADSCIVIGTSSAVRIGLPDSSVDYVITDPPFGGFVNYGELNLVWEAWLGVRGDLSCEAVVYETAGKDYSYYRHLMTQSFTEIYRVLKPGHWFTLVFHNSSNKVWALIQEALREAGFVVADVRGQGRGQGSYKQMTAAMSIKSDLIISAYRPNGGLEHRFKLIGGTDDGVWDFVRTHLKQLPVFVSTDGQAEVIAERQNYLLFDRMVAFHVQRGVTVPLPAAEFYSGLEQRFPARDGMYFLSDQVAEYDTKRMTVREVLQLQLFVTDEASAIQWLRQQLLKKPQTFQEIHPQFLKELGGWQKHEVALELSQMLEQNFLRYDGRGEVPSQIHSYLSTNFKELRNLPKDDDSLRFRGKDRWYVPDPNKAGDLEKLREKALLKEFEEYRTSSQKRLKVFRLEAVRAGFKKAWQERDYSMIIEVARKIPEDVLQEDPKLLMWYDQAVTRSGGE